MQITKNKNPYFVMELETGYVVIADYQLFKGYTIFLCKQHVKELHELKNDFKLKFLSEMSLVAEAVFKAFKPKKLNYELLGNRDEHLHWHIIPRHKKDPKPQSAIWSIDKLFRNSSNYKPKKAKLGIIKKRLLKALKLVLR